MPEVGAGLKVLGFALVGSLVVSAITAVPAVGGYSNTSSSGKVSRTSCAGSERSDSSTVGIVTSMSGGAFVQRAQKAEQLAVGAGLHKGQKIWIEPDVVLGVAGFDGSSFEITGPAVLELFRQGCEAKLRLYKGAVTMTSAQDRKVHVESVYAYGALSGEGRVRLYGDEIRYTSIEGAFKVWNPRLPQSAVELKPGFTTTVAGHFKQLQPKTPEGPKQERAIAAETAPASDWVGSRESKQIVEPKSEKALKWIQAHMTGRDFEEEDEAPIAAPGPRVGHEIDAYGQRIRKGGRSLASQKRYPKLEIVTEGKATDEEHQALLKKLRGSDHGGNHD